MSIDNRTTGFVNPHDHVLPIVPAPIKPSTDERAASFAEVALRLGGASEEEAKRTGALDSADDQVEELFEARYKTSNSPIHRAVWDYQVNTELFTTNSSAVDERVEVVIEQSLAVVRQRLSTNSLYDEHGKISTESLDELARVGYWGLLVDKEYGGSGATMKQFATMITRMATIEPTVAGLASVHGCIGAVDPLRAFGNESQKRRFLPLLASGEKLSAFALTEPGAGSDLTALKTTAVRDGDSFVVNGEKLFITNAVPGRMIGLVCKVEGKPSVLVVELPSSERDGFSTNKYGIYALRRAHNNGLVFKDFRVPVENLLQPTRGDGLTIAYHGLNLGRIALCANAAGAMRSMMAEILPWAKYRETYGQAIVKRELVQRRVGRLAGLIVAADAMAQWCAGLIDEGYRGEMECIVAKIFGSEAQKEAAIELLMKTHGGRSFLQGHMFGDNVHDFLAPCIYEGEGEMLGMAFFKSLVKAHGQTYFEPIGHVLQKLGVRQPSLLNPLHLWALKGPMVRYGKWLGVRHLRRTRWTNSGSKRDELQSYICLAQRLLSTSGATISATMRKHQLKLADRQCRMYALSMNIQSAVILLVTALYAQKSDDEVTRIAGTAFCRDLVNKLNRKAASDADFRTLTSLGSKIANEGWKEISGVGGGKVLMAYK